MVMNVTVTTWLMQDRENRLPGPKSLVSCYLQHPMYYSPENTFLDPIDYFLSRVVDLSNITQEHS